MQSSDWRAADAARNLSKEFMRHCWRIFALALCAALCGCGCHGFAAAIGEAAQRVRRVGDSRQHLVDAQLGEPLAHGGSVGLSRRPEADRDLDARQLAAKAPREVAGVI